MVTTPRRIVISGYYGFKNSGDEAVLKSILTALEQEANAQGITVAPIVLSNNPRLTKRLYGVQAVNRMDMRKVLRAIYTSHGLISGGGSLLQDATSKKTIPYYLAVIKLAQWLWKPTFIYSQGVGPVNNKAFFPFIRNAFKKSKMVSVRDIESAELLQSMGLGEELLHVVPDPVMGLPLSSDPEIQAEDLGVMEMGDSLPIVGVSLRFWREDRSDMNRIAEALRLLCEDRAVHLRFLPFHMPSDEEASRYVIERIGDIAELGCEISICPSLEQPQAMLAEVSRCELLVGMRLHSLIYAASQQVPMIGISYDPKIDNFLNRLGMEAAGTTEVLNPDLLVGEATYLMNNRSQWQQDKAEAIANLKDQASEPAELIVEYFRLKG
ncbi:polysaccharide pyruvyl transferase CsaB [Paenibacillus selenitireducens]|uniref:Polysaccharide pyruvyl transferase CsaB n=1 Tax=Paenibacillus selenitireducens TaxID=1324314 RepID=A0A1T2X784_9BACL|nr:polysaccharide pyruvyl transferase CsaB [Paenibacillus selenitireducens]OPA75685.1 polysaccharide pyruvyl transferase CsaB [Paenibacillus selenitireducens]